MEKGTRIETKGDCFCYMGTWLMASYKIKAFLFSYEKFQTYRKV